ncbi:hypothetical protein EON65_23755 [archaeon]|nr:MAG: hypothetical protein EON65_23755 [archaeon]
MDDREDSDDEAGQSVASSNFRFELHELIFAEQLGINLDEEYAGELVKIAAKALYVLPEGWEIQFTNTQQGQVPYYYDGNQATSHWAHPFLADFQVVVAERRQELIEGDDDDDDEEEASDLDDEEDEIVLLEPQTDNKMTIEQEPFYKIGIEKDPPIAHNPVEVVEEVKEDASSIVSLSPLDSDAVSALSEDVSAKSHRSPMFTPSESLAMPETKAEGGGERESFEAAIADEVGRLEQVLEAAADLKLSSEPALTGDANVQASVSLGVEIHKTDSKDSVNTTQSMGSKKAGGSGSVKVTPKGAFTSKTMSTKTNKASASLKVPSVDNDDLSIGSLGGGSVAGGAVEDRVGFEGGAELDDNKSVGSTKSVRSTASMKAAKIKADVSVKSATSNSSKKDTAVGSTASSKNEKIIVPSPFKKLASSTERGAVTSKPTLVENDSNGAATSLFDSFFEMNDTMAGLLQNYTEEVEAAPSTITLQAVPVSTGKDRPANESVKAKVEEVVAYEVKAPSSLQIEVTSGPPSIERKREELSYSPAEESRPYSSTPQPMQAQENAPAREELQSRPPVDILNDKRFVSTPVQLDKSIDIKDHFSSMFRVFAADSQPSSIPLSAASSRAGSAARQSSVSPTPPSSGTVSNLRKIVSTNRKKDGSPMRDRMPTSSTSQAAATAIAVASFSMPSIKGKKKKRSPKKGGSPNKSGWTVLGAYDTYTQAERAVQAFESVYPIISSVSKTFPCTKKLPLIGSPNEHVSSMSLRASFASIGAESIDSELDSTATRSSALLERGTIDKKAMKFAMDRPLPVIRVVRDLSRMQWLVESSDGSIKPIFVKQASKPFALPSVSLASKNESGEPQKIFAATFQPGSVFSNKNSKHVSYVVPVVYSHPAYLQPEAPSSSHSKYDVYESNSSMAKSESSSLTGSIFQNKLSSNNHDHGILPSHQGPAPSSANNTISVRSIRQLLQQQRPKSNLK